MEMGESRYSFEEQFEDNSKQNISSNNYSLADF
jgi:hypothetical protein